MFCGGCGTPNNEGSRFCAKCGKPLAAAAAPVAAQPPVAQPVVAPTPPPPVIPTPPAYVPPVVVAPPAPPVYSAPPVVAVPPVVAAPPPPPPPAFSTPVPVAPPPPPPAPPVYVAPAQAVVAPPPPPAYAPPPGAVTPGYAAPQAGVPYYTPQYAGFWLRFVALIVDGFIVGIPIGIIAMIIFAAMGGMAMMHSGTMVANPDPEAALAMVAPYMAALVGLYAFAIVGGLLFSWLYYAMMESSARQATLGKSILGLRVTDLNGNRVSFGRASGRYFSKIISNFTFYIGYIMAGFTDKKQALHDMIAGTLVIRTK